MTNGWPATFRGIHTKHRRHGVPSPCHPLRGYPVPPGEGMRRGSSSCALRRRRSQDDGVRGGRIRPHPGPLPAGEGMSRGSSSCALNRPRSQDDGVRGGWIRPHPGPLPPGEETNDDPPQVPHVCSGRRDSSLRSECLAMARCGRRGVPSPTVSRGLGMTSGEAEEFPHPATRFAGTRSRRERVIESAACSR
jgi:hypothetical protein